MALRKPVFLDLNLQCEIIIVTYFERLFVRITENMRSALNSLKAAVLGPLYSEPVEGRCNWFGHMGSVLTAGRDPRPLERELPNDVRDPNSSTATAGLDTLPLPGSQLSEWWRRSPPLSPAQLSGERGGMPMPTSNGSIFSLDREHSRLQESSIKLHKQS